MHICYQKHMSSRVSYITIYKIKEYSNMQFDTCLTIYWKNYYLASPADSLNFLIKQLLYLV